MQDHMRSRALNVASLSQRPKPRKVYKRIARIVAPYVWIAPSLILILMFTLFPIIQLFTTAFSTIDFAGVSRGYAGFKNFSKLLAEPGFLHVVYNTAVWTISIVVISMVLSIGIALLLNEDFPGRKLVRAALIIPWAASLLITASIWQWIFDYQHGTLNMILRNLHVIKNVIYWLATYSTSFPSMIWIGVFVTIPFTTFVFLAGLQTISADLYEAADVDGANVSIKFWRITLPSLRHPLMVSTVLNTIYVFNSFPIIWTVTQGGPYNATHTLITYLYSLAFQYNSMGQAAAASIFSFFLLLIFASVYGIVAIRGE